MITRVIDKLKIYAINTPMVNQASFGDISLYNHKTTIKYPYINFDVINSTNRNGIKTYKFRIYVCDRNEPLTAYNKTEVILDTLLNNIELQITNYVTNYFTLNFQDVVNGVFVDIDYEEQQQLECLSVLDDGDDYILMENGDLIKIEIIPAE